MSKKDQAALMEFIKTEFDKMREDFNQMLNLKEQEIRELHGEVETLKKRVKILENQVDDSDAYERRDTLILSGPSLPPVERGENCVSVVKKLLQDQIRLDVNESEFSVAHRLGARPQNQTSDKRSLIVKFCRRECKRDVIIACKKAKNSNLFANESLTPKRRAILEALKKMKRSLPEHVKGCTTIDGKVFVYTKSLQTNGRDHRHLVNSHDDLVKFCTDHVKQPLELFLAGWPN